jgi:hypothetical protein
VFGKLDYLYAEDSKIYELTEPAVWEPRTLLTFITNSLRLGLLDFWVAIELCTCKYFKYCSHNVGVCKHCSALDYYLRLQAKILNDVEEQIEESAPEEIILCSDL